MPPTREDAAYRLIESVIDRGHDDPDKQWTVAGPEACSMATPAFLDLRSAERFVDALNIAYCAGAAKVGTPVAIRISLDPRHEIVRRNGDAIGEVYDNGDGWQWELAGDALPPRRAVDRDAAINALVSAFNNRQTLPAALAGQWCHACLDGNHSMHNQEYRCGCPEHPSDAEVTEGSSKSPATRALSGHEDTGHGAPTDASASLAPSTRSAPVALFNHSPDAPHVKGCPCPACAETP